MCFLWFVIYFILLIVGFDCLCFIVCHFCGLLLLRVLCFWVLLVCWFVVLAAFVFGFVVCVLLCLCGFLCCFLLCFLCCLSGFGFNCWFCASLVFGGCEFALAFDLNCCLAFRFVCCLWFLLCVGLFSGFCCVKRWFVCIWFCYSMVCRIVVFWFLGVLRLFAICFYCLLVCLVGSCLHFWLLRILGYLCCLFGFVLFCCWWYGFVVDYALLFGFLIYSVICFGLLLVYLFMMFPTCLLGWFVLIVFGLGVSFDFGFVDLVGWVLVFCLTLLAVGFGNGCCLLLSIVTCVDVSVIVYFVVALLYFGCVVTRLLSAHVVWFRCGPISCGVMVFWVCLWLLIGSLFADVFRFGFLLRCTFWCFCFFVVACLLITLCFCFFRVWWLMCLGCLVGC